MATQPQTGLTAEEYLVRERLAETKSEYYKGEVFAMAGASWNHNLIVANLVGCLIVSLRKRDCRVVPSDMRLRVNESGLYTYPDVMAVCGKPIFADAQGDVLTNPILIIEVLSESTKDYDRGGKFHQYMRIPSLREYLTVSQTEQTIDHCLRQPDSSWLVREVVPANGKIALSSLNVEIDFSDVYDKIDFDQASSS